MASFEIILLLLGCMLASSVFRMTSGAGQDAQMMARICPTAMIFVPSIKGISHNPKEYTPDEDCVAGANVFLDVVSELAGAMTFC